MVRARKRRAAVVEALGLLGVSLLLAACHPARADDPPPESAPMHQATSQPPPKTHIAPPRTFGDAKRQLRKIYQGRWHETVYAGCRFREWELSWEGCCIPNRRHTRDRLEWEHVVPAAAFGRPLPAWKKGHPKCVKRSGKAYRGRRCAKKVSERFRRMEGDMHNLLPSVGRLNQARGHRGMALIAGEHRPHGTCDFELQGAAVEPRPIVRGDIARAYLYMNDRYPGLGIVTDETRPMLLRWHRADPPSAWERERNRLIAKRQGNSNSYIR